jgi:bifunctional DNase/RNase
VIVAHVISRLLRGTARGMLVRWPTTLAALFIFVGGPLFLWSRGLLPGAPPFPAVPGFEVTPSPSQSDVREMTVERFRTSRGGDQIYLVLKEKSGNRRLEMGVGQGEALSIASDMSNKRADAPVTYDLMRALVQELGGTVNRVVVNNVTETTFHAKVVMSTADRQIEVESRPSDAIALALRSKAPIFAEATVLEKAGVLGAN